MKLYMITCMNSYVYIKIQTFVNMNTFYGSNNYIWKVLNDL